MTALKSTFSTFQDYFDLFWELKISQSFRLCYTVGIVLDARVQKTRHVYVVMPLKKTAL